MHADTLNIDSAIQEFDAAVRSLFEPERRDLSLLIGRYIEARAKHRPCKELRRQIQLRKALELAA